MIRRAASRISGELKGLGMSPKEADKRGGCADGGALRFGGCLLLFVSRYVRMADGGGGSLYSSSRTSANSRAAPTSPRTSLDWRREDVRCLR